MVLQNPAAVIRLQGCHFQPACAVDSQNKIHTAITELAHPIEQDHRGSGSIVFLGIGIRHGPIIPCGSLNDSGLRRSSGGLFQILFYFTAKSINLKEPGFING